jgi:hypothetical protein
MSAATNHTRGLGLPAFLQGLVPGLLQYRLGQQRLAAIALGSCSLLFLLGWLCVRERLFYWALLTPDSPPGGRGTSALQTLARCGLPLTLPELLNLPANALGAMVAFDSSPTGERLWRMPRDFEHLAGWLTAASGMLAAFWSAAGHWELRRRRDGGPTPPVAAAHPGLCAGLSWLVPGLGHWRAGQRDKGLVMGLAVVVVFAMGLWFAHGHAVDRANASVWWIGQNLFGGGSLVAALVTGPWRMEAAPPQLDLGIVLCTVAGLMNLVVMVDAYTVAERTAFPLPKSAEVVS